MVAFSIKIFYLIVLIFFFLTEWNRWNIFKKTIEWIKKKFVKPKKPWQVYKWLIPIVKFVVFLPLYHALFIIQLIGYFGPYNGNKIKRHRELFSKDGNPLLRFSAKVAFFVPLTLWLITSICEILVKDIDIYTTSDGSKSTLLQILFQYLDPGNVANSVGFGRFLAFVSALLGIVCLSGFLVSAIVNVISQARIQWQKGLIIYKDVKEFKDYVVIIGINEQTASIARRALESDDNRYVLIQTRQDVEKVRPELESKIDDDKQDRIVYYAGDRTSYEDIEKLHLEKAIEVYILGESVENTGAKNSDEQVEKEHDAYNISCLEQISEYIKQKREKSLEEAKKKWENAKKKRENAENIGAKEKEIKKCEEECKKCRDKYDEIFNTPRLNVHVQFDYQSTFTAFKATHLYQKLGRNIRFIPFNIHELWAKKVLVDNLAIYPAGNKTELKVQRYNPIDTRTSQDKERQINGITANRDETVHLIIIGMNQMGTALATQAALLCHFPNFASKSKKTVITFIDDNAIREADYYMGRYATLFELSHYTIEKDTGEKIEPIHDHKPNFKGLEFHHLVAEIEKEGKKMSEDCLLDVEWEFIQGNAASKPVQDYIRKIVDNKQKIVTIAICFNDSQQSLASAMYLPKTVYDNCNQVLVYQRSIFDVANDVARGDSDWHRYKNLFPFGMSEASYTENPFDSHLAALDYYLYKNKERRELVKQYFDSDKMKEEANDKEKEQEEEKQKRKTFEDSFLKSVDDAWENAGIVRKTASIDSVDSIPFKLRSMGIDYCRNLDRIDDLTKNLEDNEKFKDDDKKIKEIKNIQEKIVEAEHNRWMMQRLISGFRHLSEIEQKEIHDEYIEPSKYKRLIEEIKEKERASYYICSFKKMVELEGTEYKDGMKSKDESVIELIPFLLRGQELLNVLIMTSDDERYKHSQHKKILEEIFKENFLWIEGRKEECKKEDIVYCEHSFRMADTAVSRKQWQDVTGKQLCKKEEEKEEELPVVSVSKKDVEDFLDILRKKSGLYFDIPSQKEWRTAVDYAEQDEHIWNVSTVSDKKSLPVNVKGENTSKVLHHFFGNVWEWSRSQDNHELYKFMGGSFRFQKRECKPDTDPAKDKANHYWWHSWDADSKSDDLGFRLVWKYDRGALPVDANAEKESGAVSQKNEEIDAIKKWFEEDKHKFVEVDKGDFVMGADKNASDKPDANEGPRHTVHISKPFCMCKVPVTQSLWNAVMGINKPRLNPTTNRIGDEIPQTDVSWQKGDDGEPGVKEFLEKLNKELESKTDDIIGEIFSEIVYDKEKKKWKEYIEGETKYRFRLPTEAEWEYAAKGGHKSEEPYCIYASLYNETQADTVAWYKQPSIHEVAQKEPNKLGLYDMSGNVWEWCYDYYIAEMYELCIHGNKGEDKKDIKAKFIKKENSDEYIAVNPVAQDSGYSAHVFRGGSWRSSEWDCRCTRANYWGANYKANDLGFRLVLGCPIDKLGIKENETDATKTPEQS